jgi:hypothetical protein
VHRCACIFVSAGSPGSATSGGTRGPAWARSFCAILAYVSLASEPEHKPWCGHILKRRLHASPGGAFAAIVNDYGRYGSIIDLRSGQVTLALDGGNYHPETVPISFAFAQVKGWVVAIHRTAWNRLDISDPSTGSLLTARSPTSYQRGEDRPAHYLDYFHGALHISPNSVRIVDDGWVWHPVGIPTTWSLEQWASEAPANLCRLSKILSFVGVLPSTTRSVVDRRCAESAIVAAVGGHVRVL